MNGRGQRRARAARGARRPGETSVWKRPSSRGPPRPSGEPALEARGDPGHREGEDEIDDRDEEVELEGANLTVIDDLRRLGEIHVADDRSERVDRKSVV